MNIANQLSFKNTIAFCIGICISIFSAWFFLDTNNLSDNLTACQDSTTQERFSCFRAVIEEHFTDSNLEAYVSYVQANAFTENETGGGEYAIFGTNCHTLYHALGDFVAAHRGTLPLKEAVLLGDIRCAGGYYMGFYKRNTYLNNYDDASIKAIYETCPEFAEVECAHELGHDLYEKYSHSILTVLDEISRTKYGMDIPKRTASSSMHVDLKSAFADCNTYLPEHLQPYCHSGVGHNMFLFGEINPGGYLAELANCEEVGDLADQKMCSEFLVYRVGINYAAPLFLNSRPDEGSNICEEIAEAARPSDKEEYLRHCYLGVGGGIGLFVDSEFLATEPEEDKIPQLKTELLHYANLCELTSEPFKETCFTGLFGTNFIDGYLKFRIHQPTIEKLIPYIEDFKVVG